MEGPADLRELLRLEGLRKEVESYAKVRRFEPETINDSVARALTKVLREEGHALSVSCVANKFTFFLEGGEPHEGAVMVANPYQFTRALTREILAELGASKIELYQGKVEGMVDTLVTAKVVKILKTNVICDFEGFETWVSHEDLVRSDRVHEGDSVKLMVKEVIYHNREMRVVGTRRGEAFVRLLLEEKVPEIKEGVVQLVRIWRNEGRKTYVIVDSLSPFVNPMKVIIGIKGMRIKEVKEHLPERLEVAQLSSDPIKMCENLFKDNLISARLEGDTIRLCLRELSSPNYPAIELEVLKEYVPKKVVYELKEVPRELPDLGAQGGVRDQRA